MTGRAARLVSMQGVRRNRLPDAFDLILQLQLLPLQLGHAEVAGRRTRHRLGDRIFKLLVLALEFRKTGLQRHLDSPDERLTGQSDIEPASRLPCDVTRHS
ncbi:hypothetical protein BOSEA31B_13647 [Hyphomicrobiales bacterium]|nr:hypothetical protein BOSEA31B_13647 [Hyphomicrobiales bacterium]CAH1699418.1 hypothetical protein BOSEA1005_12471 [Hyphomicrobiales bacterium]CAI0343206.1 hypothetical protein BO1005MUT1_220005 [Hyphomicrobiales bacterium]